MFEFALRKLRRLAVAYHVVELIKEKVYWFIFVIHPSYETFDRMPAKDPLHVI